MPPDIKVRLAQRQTVEQAAQLSFEDLFTLCVESIRPYIESLVGDNFEHDRDGRMTERQAHKIDSKIASRMSSVLNDYRGRGGRLCGTDVANLRALGLKIPYEFRQDDMVAFDGFECRVNLDLSRRGTIYVEWSLQNPRVWP